MDVSVVLDSSAGQFYSEGEVSGSVGITLNPATSPTARVSLLTARLLCVLTADPKWVKLPRTTASSATSQGGLPSELVGRNRRTVYETSPTSVVSGVSLSQECVTIPRVRFALRVPKDAPPSYKSAVVKFKHYVVVGIRQGEGQSSQESVTAIPIHVSTPPPLSQPAGAAVASCISVATPDGDHLVRVALRKTVLRPGECASGVCDFSGGAVECGGVEIALEQEEVIGSEWCWGQGSRRPTPRVVAEVGEGASCCQVVPFEMQVPQSACPSFSCPQVFTRWVLAFTFSLILPPSSRTPQKVHFSVPVQLVNSPPSETALPYKRQLRAAVPATAS